jgi:hypothetical protein
MAVVMAVVFHPAPIAAAAGLIFKLASIIARTAVTATEGGQAVLHSTRHPISNCPASASRRAKPTVKFEVWCHSQWNGKFQGVGNAPTQVPIAGAMATALRRGLRHSEHRHGAKRRMRATAPGPLPP